LTTEEASLYVEHFYHGWMHFFWASNFLQSFTAIIKFGRARPFFNITMIVFDWKYFYASVLGLQYEWNRWHESV